MNEEGINIRHFLIVALGANNYLHPIIDQMYYENEMEYFQIYKKSQFFRDLLMARYSTKNEEKMQRVTGIVEWCYLNDNFDMIYKLIKKGYKFSYQYFNQHKNINLDHFSYALMKKRGGMQYLSDLDLFFASVILLYLCTREGRPFSLDSEYGVIFSKALTDAVYECYIVQLRFNEERREKYKDKVDELFRYYEIPRNMKPISVNKFLELYVEKATQLKIRGIFFTDYDEIRSEIFREGFMKYIGALSNWIKVLGINEMDLTQSILLTKEILETVFLDYIIASSREANNLSNNDKDLYIFSCLFMYCLAHAYKEAKKLYLNDSAERYYTDLKLLENSFHEKESQLNDIEIKSANVLKEKNSRITQLEEELTKIQKLYHQSQLELQKQTDYTKEIVSLRNFIYTLDSEEITYEEISLDTALSFLSSKKIAIVGGHPNWQNKMKEVYSSPIYYGVDNINRDFSFVDNLDAVLINTTYFNHKFYDKLMSRMSSNQTKLFYLKGNVNIQKSILEIYSLLSQSHS